LTHHWVYKHQGNVNHDESDQTIPNIFFHVLMIFA
jgi:hypothetical protein